MTTLILAERTFADVARRLGEPEDAPYLAVLEYVQQAHTKSIEKLTDTVVEIVRTQAVMATTQATMAANQTEDRKAIASATKAIDHADGSLRTITWMFPSGLGIVTIIMAAVTLFSRSH